MKIAQLIEPLGTSVVVSKRDEVPEAAARSIRYCFRVHCQVMNLKQELFI